MESAGEIPYLNVRLGIPKETATTQRRLGSTTAAPGTALEMVVSEDKANQRKEGEMGASLCNTMNLGV